MTEPLAYLNQQWIPASEAVVSVHDLGFLMGATVAERLRTFRGELYRLEQHLERLHHSLDLVGIALPISPDQLGQAAQQLATRNHALLDPDDDLGLALFVTPGVAERPGQPTIGMHTTPLPFVQWAEEYEQGVALVTSSVRHIPAESLPPELKCRSRMHYYLAEREAVARRANARALLLDHDGHVAETSTANILLYQAREGIVSPRIDKVLPGISIAVLEPLARQLGIAWSYRDITPAELVAADEVMITSTSPCLLPVSSIDDAVLGVGRTDSVFSHLLAAWSNAIGLDIAGQATQFARRRRQ